MHLKSRVTGIYAPGKSFSLRIHHLTIRDAGILRLGNRFTLRIHHLTIKDKGILRQKLRRSHRDDPDGSGLYIFFSF